MVCTPPATLQCWPDEWGPQVTVRLSLSLLTPSTPAEHSPSCQVLGWHLRAPPSRPSARSSRGDPGHSTGSCGALAARAPFCPSQGRPVPPLSLAPARPALRDPRPSPPSLLPEDPWGGVPDPWPGTRPEHPLATWGQEICLRKASGGTPSTPAIPYGPSPLPARPSLLPLHRAQAEPQCSPAVQESRSLPCAQAAHMVPVEKKGS